MGENHEGELGQLPARANADVSGADGASSRLDLEQQNALESLMGGKSVSETARVVGVSRSTVFRWLKDNLEFQAAYNEWRESLKESCRSRLLAMADKAADTVEKAVEGGDAKSALALLKGIGLVGDVPVRSSDPEVLRREARIANRKRESKLRLDEIM
jgi:hypothetical protein